MKWILGKRKIFYVNVILFSFFFFRLICIKLIKKAKKQHCVSRSNMEYYIVYVLDKSSPKFTNMLYLKKCFPF